MNIKIRAEALEELRKFPDNVQQKILSKLKFFASTDNPLKFAHTIKGKKLGKYRFRIGNYRVIFEIEDHWIVILKIGHRKDIYK